MQLSPGTSCHLHTSVKGRFALKVIHDDAMVTVDDMLIDALPTEMLKNFVDAINAVQYSLEGHKRGETNDYETSNSIFSSYYFLITTAMISLKVEDCYRRISYLFRAVKNLGNLSCTLENITMSYCMFLCAPSKYTAGLQKEKVVLCNTLTCSL